MKPETPDERTALTLARDEFVAQWGAMGSAWGINRTMAQIHALLITTPGPMTTDEIMDDLKISRGNAHGNLRELVSWGLVRSVIRKGERREYFEAEKDVWKMFCIVMRERSRRELRPAMTVLAGLRRPDARPQGTRGRRVQRADQGTERFPESGRHVIAKISASEQSKVVPWALRFLK